MQKLYAINETKEVAGVIVTTDADTDTKPNAELEANAAALGKVVIKTTVHKETEVTLLLEATPSAGKDNKQT